MFSAKRSMNNPTVLDTELEHSARRIVMELTGSRSCRAERIPRGVMTHKFAVRLPQGETFLVRFYPASRSLVVAYEPDLIRRCAETGAKVPRVLADSRTGPRARFAYMVYEMIEGTTLSERISKLSTSDLRRLSEDLMESLALIQRVEMTGWGEPVSGWEASSSSWHEFIKNSFLEGLETIRENQLLSNALLNDIAKVEDSMDELLVARSNNLTCGDLGLGNIVLDDRNRLMGLIDFEGALAGDPLLTLGYCYAASAEYPFFESLLAGWGQRFGEIDWVRISFYALLRALRVAKYAVGPLPTGHARAPLVTVFPGLRLAVANLVNNRYSQRSDAYE